MNERELLERAARAAGLYLREEDGVLIAWRDGGPDMPGWNPLTDDGDALRLAVKLWIEVRVFNGKAHAGKQGEFWCTETADADPYAATRLAIVRAAAALAGDGSQR